MNRLDRRKCNICSKIIEPFGYMKLSDGSMCTDCAKLISPLLKNRKEADVDYMKRHIEYRKNNEAKLSTFQPEIRYGYDKKIYIDPSIFSFIVTSKLEKDISEGNPDIISFEQVTSFDTYIREYSGGGSDMYYDFIVTIKLDNEWFDEVVVKLNDDSIKGSDNRLYNKCKSDAKQLKDMLMPDKSFAASLPDMERHSIFKL